MHQDQREKELDLIKRKIYGNKLKIEDPEIRKIISKIDYDGDCIYRFLDEEKYADDFCKGDFLISTLKTCRKYEQPKGDPNEGTMTYNSGKVTGDSSDPEVRKRLQRLPISLSNCKNVTIENVSSTTKINDAFILCTTKFFHPEKMSKNYGNFCIKITNPIKFFELVTKKIRDHFKLKDAAIGEIMYVNRYYEGVDQKPGRKEFIKPPDQYSHEEEIRLYWSIHDKHLPIKPEVFSIPEVTELVERVN